MSQRQVLFNCMQVFGLTRLPNKNKEIDFVILSGTPTCKKKASPDKHKLQKQNAQVHVRR